MPPVRPLQKPSAPTRAKRSVRVGTDVADVGAAVAEHAVRAACRRVPARDRQRPVRGARHDHLAPPADDRGEAGGCAGHPQRRAGRFDVEDRAGHHARRSGRDPPSSGWRPGGGTPSDQVGENVALRPGDQLDRGGPARSAGERSAEHGRLDPGVLVLHDRRLLVVGGRGRERRGPGRPPGPRSPARDPRATGLRRRAGRTPRTTASPQRPGALA